VLFLFSDGHLLVSEELYFLDPEGFCDWKDGIFTVSMYRLCMN